ncbi:MAG: hypothetical protein D6800_11005 [Candidatus Zixiibacteriota bacterium]|nr:MAG: hypothetical protein D6800_11005 [candidate division Zixibacteria bacterium]
MAIEIRAEYAAVLSKAMKRSAAAAINKSIRQASTQAGRKVRRVYNIRARDLKQYIRYRRANSNKLVGSVGIQDKRLPLKLFAARDDYPRGVSFIIRRASGRKRLKHAFFAVVGGRLDVYERKVVGNKRVKRFPIKKLSTVSPAIMFDKEGRATIEKYLNENYKRIFEHELDYRLSRLTSV